MADTRAIMAVGEAIVALLRTAYQPADFAVDLEFRTVTARDIANNQIAAGVSFLLYRIVPNGAHRTPPGLDQQGRRRQTQLPLDLHFLMTVWGAEASLQHAIAGWAMRMFEDTPLISSGLLNATAPGSFRAEEVVELGLAELSNEDLLRIWEVLGNSTFQLSVPYLARVVRIESLQPMPEPGGLPVQERAQDIGVLRADPALEA
jgi:hypothetical protein